MPRECSRTRIVVSAVAGLSVSGVAALWGFSQWYAIEVRKSFGVVWIERGCLAMEHSTPVAMPWSPSDALAKVKDGRNHKIRAALRPIRDRSRRFASEWDPEDEVVHGFILPRFQKVSNLADFELMVGWNRIQAVLPLWALVLLITIIAAIAIKPGRYRVRDHPTRVMVEDGDAVVAGSGIRRALFLYALAWCFGLFAASMSGFWTGSYLRSPSNEDVASRARRLERILSEPEENLGDFKELPRPDVGGSPRFREHVLKGLALLKEKDPRGYQLVCRYVFQISQGEYTHALANEVPPRIELDIYTAAESPSRCARALVHEACHCKIHLKCESRGMSLDEPDWRTADELACIKESIRTAKLLGTEGWLIEYLESRDGTHWKEARCVSELRDNSSDSAPTSQASGLDKKRWSDVLAKPEKTTGR